MTFRPGDYVYPADLPRRLLCRVACAETATTQTGFFQILTLEPLAKPWNELDAPLIVRLDGDVRPVGPRDLWQATGASPA
jgi:hypothetical protein